MTTTVIVSIFGRLKMVKSPLPGDINRMETKLRSPQGNVTQDPRLLREVGDLSYSNSEKGNAIALRIVWID